MEENTLGEDLLMEKILEISYCQRCKYLKFMKEWTKLLEHLRTFFSLWSGEACKLYAFVENDLIYNLRNVYES